MTARAENATQNLERALKDGLSIVSPTWAGKTKSWVTCVCAADIDADTRPEVMVCSREGRVYLFSSAGDLRWRHVIGAKVSIDAATICYDPYESERPARIFVGTQDGKIYVLDKQGRVLTREKEVFHFDPESGMAFDEVAEKQAYWYDTKYLIRQICTNSQLPGIMVIGSDDRCVHLFNYRTGEVLWKFATNGGVRTVSVYDLNDDGKVEILIGSVDGNIYLLNQQGELLGHHYMEYPVHTISISDLDADGQAEVLVATIDNDLVALNYMNRTDSSGYFETKWEQRFEKRLLSLCVADIDTDGFQEIIAGSEDKHIYFLSKQGEVIWRHNHKHRVYSIYPCDIDDDDEPELLIGTEDKRVRAMHVRLRRAVTEDVLKYYRQLRKPDPRAIKALTFEERALLQDILPEKARKMVTFEQARKHFDAGDYGRALILALTLEQQKVERVWRKEAPEHIRTVCLRHTASKPKREIIVVTFGGQVSAFQANGQLLWSKDLKDRIVDVQTGFIERNKQEEIVICSSNQHVYILGKTEDEFQIQDTFMSSICVLAPDRQGLPEIIIGSERNKLYIYQDDLDVPPRATIPTKEGVKIVRAHQPAQDHMPEIITASLGNHVYAYTRGGDNLWCYETRGQIHTIALKDVNNDGKAEILVGSQDCNIHVLGSDGHLLWRYYLPHTVLTIDTIKTTQEVVVGCADGLLYIFNKDGDLQWTYQAADRINSVCVEDIEGDGNIEIVLGSEKDFELLRVINQRQVTALIMQCWTALCQQQPALGILQKLLQSPEPLLQAFALTKQAEVGKNDPGSFDLLEPCITKDDIEVRKALVEAVIACYTANPARARILLYQLSGDNELAVRNTLIDHLPALLQRDWEEGFPYLVRASENPDRFVRRLVTRRLCLLIDACAENPVDRHREIFSLLLAAARDKESHWVRQEAARTLGHFLDQHQGNFIVYIHLFIVKDLREQTWEWIAYATKQAVIKRYIHAVRSILFDLNEQNISDRLQQMIYAEEMAANLRYGEDLIRIYKEFAHLFTLQTIDELADYQCSLEVSHLHLNNQFARVILEVFNKLSAKIGRLLKIYFQRDGIYDRLASLLEGLEAIEQMRLHIEKQFAQILLGEPLTRLPERRIFFMLLSKWKDLVQEQLNELRGNAEIEADLQTREAPIEEQVGIWLTVKNAGQSSATDLRVRLLHGEDFEETSRNPSGIDLLSPGTEITCEFVIKPHRGHTQLNLRFEITYVDVDRALKTKPYEAILELREYDREFHFIDNLYSTGTPTHDRRMFYGRKEDIAFLQPNLTSDVKSVIVLFGQRRSGKTTLLIHLVNSSILGENIPVLIDMQRLSYQMTVESLFRRMASYIAQALRRRNMIVATPDTGDFQLDPTHAFDLFLDGVEEQLANRKLILLIDEFEVLEDQVTKGALKPEIFEYLRDVVQHRQKLNVLFSGTHQITKYTKWYRSVFFNIALHHRLSHLSVQDAEDLIRKPVEGFLEYDPLTVKKIHQLTADQPYLIHLMCRAIVDYCNDRRKSYVTINDVNIVLQSAMQTGQFHFDWLWDQIRPEERVALAALAEGTRDSRWLSFAELIDVYRRHHIVSYKHEYILDALKTLSDADVIEEGTDNTGSSTLDNRRYRIPVGLTRGWLLKEHPIELVRSELID